MVDEEKRKKEALFAKLNELIDGGYYGKFVINLENGKITHCKKTESIKL